MNSNEKGFALIELMVTIAISALIAVGAGMTVSQIIRGSQHGSDWTTAIRQAQNVGYWVSQDILMGESIAIGDNPETADIEFIDVYRKDWETGDTYEISYIYLDSVDSLKKLKRNQLICDKDGVATSNISTFIADNIYTANLSSQDGVWKLNVEVRSGERSVNREYQINQRQEN